jgi:diacylglycerol kinase (ATP)
MPRLTFGPAAAFFCPHRALVAPGADRPCPSTSGKGMLAGGMKYILIANPVSGDGSSRRKIGFVRDYFLKHGIEIDVLLTERVGHATELARSACEGYDVIIGGGGDGTINELLNGMAGSGRTLAILPWGTGNVFAHEMHLPDSLRAACRLILKGSTARLDLGRCGDRLFLLMAGAGLDAYSLSGLKAKGIKRRLGLLAYLIAALRGFAQYRYPEIEVELADGRRDRGSLVIVSNTSRYGSFFSFTPRANPLDGLLDLFVFEETGRWNTLWLALRYFTAFAIGVESRIAPLGLLRFKVYRCSGLSLRSHKRVQIQIDGEPYSELPLDISVVPAAIDILLPQRTIRKYGRLPPRSGPS